jgi:hypothetical protein
LIGSTCALYGFSAGELRCTDRCTIDRSGCFDPPPTAPPVLVVSPKRLVKRHVRTQSPCPDPFGKVSVRKQGGGELPYRMDGEPPAWLLLQGVVGTAPGEIQADFTCAIPPGEHVLTFGLDLRPIDPATGEPIGPPETVIFELEVSDP